MEGLGVCTIGVSVGRLLRMPDVRRLGALVLYQAELKFSVGMTT